MKRILTCNAAVFTAALFLVAALSPLSSAAQGGPQWTPRVESLLSLPYPSPPKVLLDAFLGIPYRSDGAVNLQGRFTLFADPGVVFDTSGLNCSGFVLVAYRLIMQAPVSLEAAKQDRLQDSGPGAAKGQDWDFGWDFIQNLTEGYSPRLLIPQGETPLPQSGVDGATLRGFALRDAAAWRAAIAHLRPGELVLLSMSKPWNKNGYSLLHHHVALLLPTADGGRWYYHAVGKGGVTRTPLHDPAALKGLLDKYPASSLGERKVLMLVVDLPQ